MASRPTTDRLDRLRGPVPPRNYDARTVAALTANPGCTRRAVLDAAGIDKRALAEHLGFGLRFGQSPFAISRANSFSRQIREDRGVTLAALLRGPGGLLPATADDGAVDGLSWSDLGDGDGDASAREQRTADLLAAATLPDPESGAAFVDHPLLVLDVAGRTGYFEPDALLLGRIAAETPAHDAGQAAPGGTPVWHFVLAKSFPVIDGRADPAQAGAAATEAAVYVAAVQDRLLAQGRSAAGISTDVILVCPKDFTNTPIAAVLDVRKQLAAVRRQLARLPRVTALAEAIDDSVTLDLRADSAGTPTRDPGELGAALTRLEPRYVPDCVSRCDLAFRCRHEARAAGSTDLLGRDVRDALGGVDSVARVLELAAADPSVHADASDADEFEAAFGPGGALEVPAGPGAEDSAAADLAEAARLLAAARRARDEALQHGHAA